MLSDHPTDQAAGSGVGEYLHRSVETGAKWRLSLAGHPRLADQLTQVDTGWPRVIGKLYASVRAVSRIAAGDAYSPTIATTNKSADREIAPSRLRLNPPSSATPTRATRSLNTRSPARAVAARAASGQRQPHRRAWLRIFVVRCGLPCDPPVGEAFGLAICRAMGWHQPADFPTSLLPVGITRQ
jgi:hypothetical protein